jgi:hypothetical protein
MPARTEILSSANAAPMYRQSRHENFFLKSLGPLNGPK